MNQKADNTTTASSSKKRLISLFVTAAVSGVVVATLLWGGEVLAPTGESLRSDPTDEGPIMISVEIDRDTYSYGDEMQIRAEIENVSDEVQEYTFNSGCTDAEIYISEQPTRQLVGCPTVITDVSINPGETIDYSYIFEVVEAHEGPDILEYEGQVALSEGEHAIHAEWQDATSNQLFFTVE